MTDKTTFWQGEVQLLGWSETNTRGRTITLQLGEDEETHPFKYSNTRHGKTSGKRFVVVFVEIGDDEKPVEKTPSQMAWLLCYDPDFWLWANDQSFETVNSDVTARDFILKTCLVQSRGEIDSVGHAKLLWDSLVYDPFCAWRKERYAV